MKNKVELLIKEYVKHYSETRDVQTRWKEPLVAYADSRDEMFYDLKNVVSTSNPLPKDLLPEAKTVVAYFLPFDDAVIQSNIARKESSEVWARAYVETNSLISDLNIFIKSELEKLGYKAVITSTAHKFDSTRLISDWSHRHVAIIAGLGKFGLNNMLITEKGCCGRISTFITDLKIEATKRENREHCLYKHNGSCSKCVDMCVNNALKVDSFDRRKCYEMCLYNDNLYSYVGSGVGTCDVCGKCLVGIPCSSVNPLKIK